MGPFRILYIDMNSFFASVEQQIDPTLRGRPVAITAMENEKGCCVAASYEAKAFGIRTGVSVAEARRICPEIRFRASRHRLYVRYNLRVAEVLDRHAELERIRSVDEFQLGLSGETSELDGALALVRRLKAAVAEEVGPCLRFSAGIGPNHLLAKIAGKLEKPDGCQWLGPGNMPDRIADLPLDALPGISRRMMERLIRAGVPDVPALCRLDPRHARMIWHSVEGERFVRALRGEAIPLVRTQRGGYGSSKVLAPEFRAPAEAYLVSRWLIEKAAARLRRDRRVASAFGIFLWPLGHRAWSGMLSCAATQDTAEFLHMNRTLWRAAWPEIRQIKLRSIGVQIAEVDFLDRRSGDLFTPLGPAERSRGEKVSNAVDALNNRFGAGTVTFGINRPHPGFFERG